MAIFLFKDFPTGKVITTFYPNKKYILCILLTIIMEYPIEPTSMALLAVLCYEVARHEVGQTKGQDKSD